MSGEHAQGTVEHGASYWHSEGGRIPWTLIRGVSFEQGKCDRYSNREVATQTVLSFSSTLSFQWQDSDPYFGKKGSIHARPLLKNHVNLYTEYESTMQRYKTQLHKASQTNFKIIMKVHCLKYPYICMCALIIFFIMSLFAVYLSPSKKLTPQGQVFLLVLLTAVYPGLRKMHGTW